jgi:Carboxypeptidase regulatory-like domain
VKGVLCCAFVLLLSVGAMFAQVVGQDDSYVNRNQIDYGPLRLSRVAGIARDEHGAVVPAIRVLLFTEQDHKLVASTVTDERGSFVLDHIPSGRYRLVAKSVFCPANVPIQVDNSGQRLLHLHMRVGGIDTCSYGTLKN